MDLTDTFVLVHNAGQGLHLPLEDVGPDDFGAVPDLNAIAPLVAMQAVLPVMRAQGGGAIVNVSSATTRTRSAPSPGEPARPFRPVGPGSPASQ